MRALAMVDVTVFGAGVAGLSVAWSCARRGARVQVVDPNGVAAGASGGIVGALAPHVPENWNAKKAFQFDSLIMADRYWAEVDQVGGGHSGYLRSGRVQPLIDQHAMDLAKSRHEEACILWQGLADWTVAPVSNFGDWAPYSPTGYVIQDTLSARIHPRNACLSLVAAIRAKGGMITPKADAKGHIVYATGVADIEAINATRTRQFGNGVKGQAALLRLDRRDLPQLFADTMHIVPHSDGTVAIGATSEREFTDLSTDQQLDDLIARACQAVPVLRSCDVIARWAGIRPRSRSRAPVMGHHPLYKGAYIVNGGFKIGFGMAPKQAEVMTDLILEGRDEIPQEFRPDASF